MPPKAKKLAPGRKEKKLHNRGHLEGVDSVASSKNGSEYRERDLYPDASDQPSTSKSRKRKTAQARRSDLTTHANRTPPTSEKIAGDRMSSAKYSGLLARDERETEGDKSGEDCLSFATQLPQRAGTEETDGDVATVTGKDIFAIRSVSQSRLKRKRERKEMEKETNEVLDGSRRKQWREETAESSCIGSREVDGRKEPRAAGKGEERVAKGKGRKRKRAQLTSDSEPDNFSLSGEEESEDMAAVAAQLNRGLLTENALEDFFTAHSSQSGGVTSDRTLARLARPRLDHDVVHSTLQTAPSPFLSDRQQLCTEHSHLYPYWLLQLHSGFNILLYGVGSKKTLIENFRKQYLFHSCSLVINGYFPGLTVKHILSSLSSELLGHSGSFKSHSEHAQFITSALEGRAGVDTPSEVFLLIHNIDGPMLRNEKAQAALSVLATSPHIAMVASIDHINAPLLWDQAKLGRFKWAWHDVTTFELYQHETSYENSLLVRHSGALTLSSLTHVVSSLPLNSQGMFRLLADYQLQHRREAEGHYPGLPFSDLYRRCREEFLVNSDLTLRSQLTEFIDHKLIRSSKGNDGVEYLSIPVEDATLTHFLELAED